MAEPGDYNHPLLEAAISLHEMFITLQQAGFTASEALFIVAQAFRPKDGV